MDSFKAKQKTLFNRQLILRNNPTESELIFRTRLEDASINFIFQKCFIAGDYYCIVDFYLPKPRKIVIEIDGGYHSNFDQVYKDSKKDEYLIEKRKFKVIRIKNEDVSTFDLNLLSS